MDDNFKDNSVSGSVNNTPKTDITASDKTPASKKQKGGGTMSVSYVKNTIRNAILYRGVLEKKGRKEDLDNINQVLSNLFNQYLDGNRKSKYSKDEIFDENSKIYKLTADLAASFSDHKLDPEIYALAGPNRQSKIER